MKRFQMIFFFRAPMSLTALDTCLDEIEEFKGRDVAMSSVTVFSLLGKVRFELGGWAGALEGRVISKYFTNWGGSNLFDTQPREGHSFFWQGKYYSMSVS